MNPPVFALLTADATVLALLSATGSPSTAPVFDSGYAPEGVSTYVVWAIVSGVPENYVGDRPDLDAVRVQIDTWAPTRPACLALAQAVQFALETESHQVSLNLDERDELTRLHRLSMDFEFWLSR